MAIVALISRKGGVGKTSICIALADYLSSMHGLRILVIDADPQANATLGFMDDEGWAVLERQHKTIADLFQTLIRNDPFPDCLWPANTRVKGNRGQVSLLPGSPRLQAIEEEMLEGDKTWRRYRGSPYLVLQQGLRDITPRFDHVLIDCPPSMGLVTMNAVSLADGYLMPTIADNLSTAGLAQVVQRVREHAEAFRIEVKRYGTVINRFKTTSNLHAVVQDRLRVNPDVQPLWDTVLPDTVRSEEGWEARGAITLLQRYGYFHGRLEALAAEFRRRIG